MNRMKSQCKQIKEWLESGKSITPIDALNLFGCFRLGARIWDLRHIYRMEIESCLVDENGKRFAEYFLKEA